MMPGARAGEGQPPKQSAGEVFSHCGVGILPRHRQPGPGSGQAGAEFTPDRAISGVRLGEVFSPHIVTRGGGERAGMGKQRRALLFRGWPKNGGYGSGILSPVQWP